MKSDSTPVSFFLHPRIHEELKIRLYYEGFATQSEFFRACTLSLLEKNEKFMEFLDHYRENEGLMSKAKLRKSKKLREDGKDLMKELGITKEDVENIFDLIEEEIPEL
jgi:hypothetical protein|tara:strand:- start:571 stop:894 length:324 start_codon:yes stop_codon:yes gene_type:complete